MPARFPAGDQADPTLIRALFAALEPPTLMLDGDLVIREASPSILSALAESDLVGRPLAEVAGGALNLPAIMTGLRAAASGTGDMPAQSVRLTRGDGSLRRLSLTARRLDLGAEEPVRVLLSATDLTEAAREQDAREAALADVRLKLQDMPHRVANSLQIVAGMLNIGARRASVAEARQSLREAHGRVIAIAALERHLAASTAGRVRAEDYLGDLCERIESALLGQAEHSLELDVDDSVIEPELASSLGLIAAELVINAVKHAFPHGQGGSIVMRFRSEAQGWVFSVSDDGVGMPVDPVRRSGGLGGGIVAGLARRLNVRLETRPAFPGTVVTLTSPGVRGLGPDTAAGFAAATEILAPPPGSRSSSSAWPLTWTTFASIRRARFEAQV